MTVANVRRRGMGRPTPGWATVRTAADMQRAEAGGAEANVKREGAGGPEPIGQVDEFTHLQRVDQETVHSLHHAPHVRDLRCLG